MSTQHVVVMGVSGSGKTTVASGIAVATDFTFAEADEYHPEANVAKMAAGEPLTDADRWPWLAELATWMADRAADDAARREAEAVERPEDERAGSHAVDDAK